MCCRLLPSFTPRPLVQYTQLGLTVTLPPPSICHIMHTVTEAGEEPGNMVRQMPVCAWACYNAHPSSLFLP